MSEEPTNPALPEHIQHDAAWEQLSQGDKDLLANEIGMAEDGTRIIQNPAATGGEPEPPENFAADEVMAWRYGKEAALRIIEKDSSHKEKQRITSQHEETQKKLSESELRRQKAVKENNIASRTNFELSQRNAKLADENQDLKPLAEKAPIDNLTKIYNRLGLYTAYQNLAGDQLRHGRTDFEIAVLFIDLDGFKEFNDAFGHKKGDQMLRFIAQRFASRLSRASDVVGRLGGDEFVAFVPGVNQDEAMELAEALRESVSFGAGELDGEATGLGASIGVTIGDFSDPSEEGFENMMEDADKAMYEAKKQGKNRVVRYNGH